MIQEVALLCSICETLGSILTSAKKKKKRYCFVFLCSQESQTLSSVLTSVLQMRKLGWLERLGNLLQVTHQQVSGISEIKLRFDQCQRPTSLPSIAVSRGFFFLLLLIDLFVLFLFLWCWG
jgi:hypothetical protein